MIGVTVRVKEWDEAALAALLGIGALLMFGLR